MSQPNAKSAMSGVANIVRLTGDKNLKIVQNVKINLLLEKSLII